MRCVQKMLQDELCGDRIEHGFAILPVFLARAAKFRVRLGRAEALVDEGDGNIEAAVQLVGEASAAPGQRMLGAVGRGRQADDQAHRLPFGDQRLDALEARGVRFGRDRFQGVRLARLELSRGDTDARQAEIETQ